MSEWKVPVQSLIDHIKTAVDVDPWAKEMAEELLKEQEAVEPINSYGTFRCGNCNNIVGYNDGLGRGYQNNFCSKCGKQVKWE